MLERNLIYTGMTRAKELLIIIGNKKSLQIGVQKQTVKERSTLLSKQLNSQFIENMWIKRDSLRLDVEQMANENLMEKEALLFNYGRSILLFVIDH